MLMLARRTFLRAGSAAVAATALAPTALARAPQVGKPAELGFYRFKLGTIEVTVVSDGTLAFPAETLWGDRAGRGDHRTRRPGGDTQKQADIAAGALAKADPARL